MNASYKGSFSGTKFPTETSCGGSRKKLREISPLMRVAQGLWPSNTADNLHAVTKRSKRQCENYLAGRSRLPEAAIKRLLATKDGLKFLEALMGDALPDWWAAFRYDCEMADTRARIAALKEKQKGLHRRSGR